MEIDRIRFLCTRDGDALNFSKQTVNIYRKAVLSFKRRGFNKTHRQPFIESYVVLKKYISVYLTI